MALNHERAAEEKRGLIRWLRPEFQNKAGAAAVQQELDTADEGGADDDADEVGAKKPARGRGGTGKSAAKPTRARYAFVVPFVADGDVLFMNTIIPSRKMTKRYLGDRR